MKTIALIGALIALLIVVDEFAYYAWKKLNPGHMYSGLLPPPYPPITWDGSTSTDYPNGYRPAGGI